jgi:hypothetical protein
MKNQVRQAAFAAFLAVACGAESPEPVGAVAEALSAHDFDVDFSDCSELAGIGFVPAANVRALVPASYALAGDTNNAVLVARAVSCGGISVAGKKAQTGVLSQIGVSVTGADPSADINNYTLWFDTDNALLAAKLGAAGVSAEHGKPLFSVTTTSAGNQVDFFANVPRVPQHELAGPFVPPTAAPGPFTATWWFDARSDTVRMRTVLPNIRFGSATLTLTTPAGSALSQVIGGTSMTFALLDSYNTFADAHLEVRAVAHP